MSWDNYRHVFESRISAGAKKKTILFSETWCRHLLMVPVIWKVMQRNVWSDIARWRIQTTQQIYKVATPCLDDHCFQEATG